MSASTDDLEIRIAYQEQAIDEMSRQLFTQTRTIEQLVRRCEQLERRLEGLVESGFESVDNEPPPPHY